MQPHTTRHHATRRAPPRRRRTTRPRRVTQCRCRCRPRPSVRLRRHLSTGHPHRSPPSPQHNTFFGPHHHRRHYRCCLPCCPHFPWAHSQHFSIPKSEYDSVVQLTTQKRRKQCNDPRSDSVSCACILKYRIYLLMLVAQPTIYAQCLRAL